MARPLWKGAISFGLVTIPVSLYTGESARDNVAFRMLHQGDLRPVRTRWVDDNDHEIPYEEIVKGYEYEKDRYVVIDEADLKVAAPRATQTIEIMHFVDAGDIAISFYDTPYYTEPTAMGRKAYALLRETLRRTGKSGVARLVIRERQHLCAVLADGPVIVAYTLRWPYQLRPASDLDLPSEELDELAVSPQELEMAEQLVQTMTVAWEPEQYRDTYRDELLEVIEEKIKTGTVTTPALEETAPAGEAEVVDIVALLKQSVKEQRGRSRKKPSRQAG